MKKMLLTIGAFTFVAAVAILVIAIRNHALTQAQVNTLGINGFIAAGAFCFGYLATMPLASRVVRVNQGRFVASGPLSRAQCAHNRRMNRRTLTWVAAAAIAFGCIWPWAIGTLVIGALLGTSARKPVELYNGPSQAGGDMLRRINDNPPCLVAE
jgi:hypothetical protein